jgi:DNA-binding CsgD family transcriptional regulator
MAASVVGRDAELALLNDFIAAISGGASLLVLEGEAGMGKTTLWEAGVGAAEAVGVRVLLAQPAESETALSFSGLGDLLDPVLDEALEPLPAAQRSALSRALVLEEVEGPPPDARAAGVALLSALRGLARERDLLVAVDDVQWLDAASAAALVYAARRLKGERIGILLARRSGGDASGLEELKRVAGCHVLDVGPLEADALYEVVQAQLGVALPRPLLAEVRQASGGNPFYALEIVRMLRRSKISVEAGQPLPVPESLHELVHGHLLALPEESRDFLLAAAAHAHPTLSITETASGIDRTAGLRPALEGRVVELDGERIRFTHPLLAAGAYEMADPLRRREIHARLADLLDDPEARAWQLAAVAEEPAEHVAAALEDAARHARGRGAPRPAALLLDRAHELTPADRPTEACRRAVDAAYLHYESGDTSRAEAQLEEVIARLAPGRMRAMALARLGRVRLYVEQEEAAELFLRAIAEADDDRATLAAAHEGVATSLFRARGRLSDTVEHASLATRLALDVGDERLAAEAIGSRLLAETLLGRDSAAATADVATGLQAAAGGSRVLAQPSFSIAVYRWWTDDLEHARDAFASMVVRLREIGDESSAPTVLVLLGHVECLLGALVAAKGHAVEAQEYARQAGQSRLTAYGLALESLVEAYRGAEQRAREVAHGALSFGPEIAGRYAELVAREALGGLELSLGDARAALAQLEPAITFVQSEAIAEPAAARFVVDHVEALVQLGRTVEAGAHLDRYEGDARRLGRVSALANCARCRGLLAAHVGELDAAIAAFGEALAWHAKVELPLDHGRTLLALGAAQRRLKRRREARATLEQALALFERTGAALWADRARAELKRISGRAATPGALTPAEERVAALVAEGKTNKEVAAALFLSDRTVEGHLARIFGKLGIRHRTELAGALHTRGISVSNTGDSPVSAGSSAP